jgi:SanA protein
MTKTRKIIMGVCIVIAFASVTIYYCNQQITQSANARLYNSVTNIPYKKTGLLLGTGKYLKNGSINPYYQYRINATIDLLRANKIKYLIISGDNSTLDYNEPAMMRKDLMQAGIDSTVIYLDYAGFRTFDSMVRVKEIFGQTDVTIISQQFHNERAIFIAQKEQIEAIGFNAQDVPLHADLKVKTREKLARVKVFVDYIFQTKPKFLGEKINIPA